MSEFNKYYYGLSESQVERMVFSMMQNGHGRKKLREKGLLISEYGRCFKQPVLPGYGRADLIDIYVDETDSRNPRLGVDIIELKVKGETLTALGQALRYNSAIKQFLRLNDISIDDIYIELIIITGDSYYEHELNSHCENIKVYNYDFDPIDGISFHNYGGVNENKFDASNFIGKVFTEIRKSHNTLEAFRFAQQLNSY